MSLNKNYLVLFFLFPAVLFSQGPAVSKDSILQQDLEEVIVTATRTVRQLSALPLPAQLISKEQIKTTGSLRLNDILNEQTGIITVPDFGGVEGVQMQGLDAQYTLILIDGVPLVGRSAGTLDLNRITLGNVKQIEIVKGPSSSLYGSEALGGVINIITETPEKSSLQGSLDSRAGSFETYDTNVQVTFGSEKLGISAYFNDFRTQGFDLNEANSIPTVAPFNNQTGNLQFRYDPSEKLKFLVSGRFFRQDADVFTLINEEVVDGTASIDEWNVHTRGIHKPSDKFDITYEMYVTGYKADQAALFVDDLEVQGNSYYNERLIRPEIRASYELAPKNILTIGAGGNYSRLDRTFFDEQVAFDALYGFAQYDFHLFEKVNIIAGARFDKHNIYESAFTPKLAVNYRLNTDWSLRASAGFGFKVPDLRQLFFDFENNSIGYVVLGYNVAAERLRELDDQGRIQNFTVPLSFFDDELSTENSVGYNFGFVYNRNKLKADVNFFYNEIENLIDIQAVARLNNGQNIFSYRNIGQVFTGGLETNLIYRFSRTLKLQAGYQYLIAKDQDVIDRIREEGEFARDPETLETIEIDASDYFGLYNRSRHTANFKAFYSLPKWNSEATFRATYRSKYGLFDSNNNGFLDDFDRFADPFVLLDASFSKRFGKHYLVQAGVDNLLDFTDPANATNIAGRIIYGKVQFNF
ncbi:TonB-dependent receptor [Ascidiimonas aurantiaca]|uniref:TonB-dependent receptor plug domain-containing protein n=1 Tax=Ascidiimonas aurantiaca TaxID=1685432 RepID=UPI0030EE09B5